MPRTRQQDAARKQQFRAAHNDQPPPAPPANPARREACRLSFRAFCDSYGAARFPWPWSPDHLDILANIERAVLDGGQYLVVCPRGSGKSTILEFAVVWASAYGHRRYIVPVTATGDDAATFLDGVKSAWEGNDELAADFPEVSVYLRACEGVTLRAKRMTIAGEPAHMDYSAGRIIYPWHADGERYPSRGVVIEPRSITGRLRGTRHVRPDGATVRPDLLVPDDVQTDESAASSRQVRTRLRLLNADALGMAGPGVRMAAVMLGTIIAPGDVVDTMLHSADYHTWAGRRMQLVYQWPDAQDTLWREYAEIRRRAKEFDDLPGKAIIYAEADAYYAARRAEMDAGARVMWDARKEPGELSALHHAENLLIDRGLAVFSAEYQNDPQEDAETASPLTVDGVMARLNRQPRWAIPDQCEYMAAKVDVGASRLHLTVIAAEPNGTPYLVHCQTWPARQSQTIADMYPGMAPEAQLYAALDALATASILPERRRMDGTPMRISRLHVDAGWKPGTVRRWCRQGVAAGIAHPEEGAKTSAAASPLAAWKPRPGERRGDAWLIQPARNGSRTVIVDTHHWKTYLADRLQTPLGTPGSLTLFGADPAPLRDLAEHCCAEYPASVAVNGGTPRQVWRMRPGKTDNHYFDCLAGSLVALSVLGCQYRAGDANAPKIRPRPRRRAHCEIT